MNQSLSLLQLDNGTTPLKVDLIHSKKSCYDFKSVEPQASSTNFKIN